MRPVLETRRIAHNEPDSTCSAQNCTFVRFFSRCKRSVCSCWLCNKAAVTLATATIFEVTFERVDQKIIATHLGSFSHFLENY